MSSEWEFIGPYLPIGEYGPYPERLRQRFEGVIRRFTEVGEGAGGVAGSGPGGGAAGGRG